MFIHPVINNCHRLEARTRNAQDPLARIGLDPDSFAFLLLR